MGTGVGTGQCRTFQGDSGMPGPMLSTHGSETRLSITEHAPLPQTCVTATPKVSPEWQLHPGPGCHSCRQGVPTVPGRGASPVPTYQLAAVRWHKFMARLTKNNK